MSHKTRKHFEIQRLGRRRALDPQILACVRGLETVHRAYNSCGVGYTGVRNDERAMKGSKTKQKYSTGERMPDLGQIHSGS